jgi:hypothetical protein
MAQFQNGRAILQSGECQSTLNEDIRAALPYNSIEGSGETVGERFATDLGITDRWLDHSAATCDHLRGAPADAHPGSGRQQCQWSYGLRARSKTVGEYRDYLRQGLHSAYLQLQSDEFAYGAYPMAEAMAGNG